MRGWLLPRVLVPCLIVAVLLACAWHVWKPVSVILVNDLPCRFDRIVLSAGDESLVIDDVDELSEWYVRLPSRHEYVRLGYPPHEPLVSEHYHGLDVDGEPVLPLSTFAFDLCEQAANGL